MRKIYKSALVFALAVLVGVTASGCGCGKKKEPEAEASQVLKISITPEVTPTVAPDMIDADAVEKNGNLIMVNGYKAENAVGGTVSVKVDGNQNEPDQAEDGSDDDME